MLCLFLVLSFFFEEGICSEEAFSLLTRGEEEWGLVRPWGGVLLKEEVEKGVVLLKEEVEVEFIVEEFATVTEAEEFVVKEKVFAPPEKFVVEHFFFSDSPQIFFSLDSLSEDLSSETLFSSFKFGTARTGGVSLELAFEDFLEFASSRQNNGQRQIGQLRGKKILCQKQFVEQEITDWKSCRIICFNPIFFQSIFSFLQDFKSYPNEIFFS